MGHNSVVSGYPKSTEISQVDGLSMGPLDLGRHKALEVIFTYGYGCCVFKHNICGDHPEVPEGMPDSTDPFPP